MRNYVPSAYAGNETGTAKGTEAGSTGVYGSTGSENPFAGFDARNYAGMNEAGSTDYAYLIDPGTEEAGNADTVAPLTAPGNND